MADATAAMRLGEKRPVYGSATAEAGTLLISGQPIVTLYDSLGAVVSGFNGINVTGYESSALATVQVWLLLDSAGLSAGRYSALFSFVATGSDGIARRFKPEIEIEVRAAPELRGMAYPTGSDLAAYIRSLGVLDEDTAENALAAMNLDGKAQAAVREWESATGYRPFLSTGSVTTRRFDPAPTLFLGAGLLSLSSLTTGATFDQAGTVRTLNRDFFLQPENAPEEGLPYTRIAFHYGWESGWGCRASGWGRRSVVIEGVWGYGTTLPDDAWEALVRKGAILAYEELALAVSGGFYSIRSLNSEVRYAGGKNTPLSNEVVGWQKVWDQAVSGYWLPSL